MDLENPSTDQVKNQEEVVPYDVAPPIFSVSNLLDTIPEPSDEPAPQKPSAPYEPFIERHSLLFLLLITLLGGIFRFIDIDKPALWTDELYTFRRVAGTFRDMLDVLAYDGFSPLLYEAYYVLCKWVGGPANMTPFYMRLIPAICGTAMIPAMYLLSRGLFSKKTSLAVALFTACSAFMMVYSRDAKMYMPLWLGVALSVGCLLWWFRSGLRFAWLCWIAAGVFLAGLHLPGLLALIPQPIMLLTQKRMHWKKLLMFLVGLAVVASGPLVHYTQFNRLSDRVDEEGSSAYGLAWIPSALRGRDGEDLVKMAASTFATSWEWPSSRYNPEFPKSGQPMSAMLQGYNITPQRYWVIQGVLFTILLLMILGAFPWTRRTRGLIEPSQSAWRPVLCLGAWIFIPAWAFYRITLNSMGGDPIAPLDWIYQSSDKQPTVFLMLRVTPIQWVYALAGAAGLAALLQNIPKIARWLAWGYMILLGLWVLMTIFVVPPPLEPFKNNPGTELAGLWTFIHREISGLWKIFFHHQWSETPINGSSTRPWTTIGLMWLTLIMAPALAWHYGGNRVLGRLQNSLKLLAGLAGVFGLVLLTEYFVAVAINDPKNKMAPIWFPRYLGAVWPAFALVVCGLLMRLPTRALRIGAMSLLIGVNVWQAHGRIYAGTEPRMDLIVKELYQSQSRAVGNRPAQKTDFRMYLQTGGGSANPGGAGLTENSPKYYAAIERGKAWHPQDYRGNNVIGAETSIWNYSNPNNVANDLGSNPNIKHITIWTRHDKITRAASDRLKEYQSALDSVKGKEKYWLDGVWYSESDAGLIEKLIKETQEEIASPTKDDVLAAIEKTGKWKLVKSEWFPVRYHWNFSELYVHQRREYVRED